MRDYIQAQRNHFPEIEEAAETPGRRVRRPGQVFESLRRRLQEGFGVETRLVPPELLDFASQAYDLHRKRLMLSTLLRPESRTSALAYQLALFEFAADAEAAERSAGAARRADRRGCSTCRSPIMRRARS